MTIGDMYWNFVDGIANTAVALFCSKNTSKETGLLIGFLSIVVIHTAFISLVFWGLSAFTGWSFWYFWLVLVGLFVVIGGIAYIQHRWFGEI
jgi:hypothetical protein